MFLTPGSRLSVDVNTSRRSRVNASTAALVYSRNFFQLRGLSGPAPLVVPAGKVWIARDLDVYGNFTAGGDFFFEGPSLQTIYWTGWNPGDRFQRQWSGRQVFTAGSTITVRADVGPLDGIDVTLSGYELSA